MLFGCSTLLEVSDASLTSYHQDKITKEHLFEIFRILKEFGFDLITNSLKMND